MDLISTLRYAAKRKKQEAEAKEAAEVSETEVPEKGSDRSQGEPAEGVAEVQSARRDEDPGRGGESA